MKLRKLGALLAFALMVMVAGCNHRNCCGGVRQNVARPCCPSTSGLYPTRPAVTAGPSNVTYSSPSGSAHGSVVYP